MTSAPVFEPKEVLRTLDLHGVRYVLIGGLAATLHGSPHVTGDTDVCAARDPENLRRLARALVALDARFQAPDAAEGVPFARDEHFLAGVDLVNLVTRHGDFDVSFRPAGTEGYDDLAARAVTYDLGGVAVPTAALEDVIRSKEAANRPKDHLTLPILRALLAHLRVSGR